MFVCSLRFSDQNISVANCEGSTKYGSNIYIDFNKINRPCSCTVTTSFIGSLLVISREGIKGIEEKCNTQVMVKSKYDITFKCAPPSLSSARIDVQINQSVPVRAEYLPFSTSGTFYHCLQFQEIFGMLVHLSFFIVIIGFFVVLNNKLTEFLFLCK